MTLAWGRSSSAMSVTAWPWPPILLIPKKNAARARQDQKALTLRLRFRRWRAPDVVIAAPPGIVLSTGGIPANYEIVDVVFAHASAKEAEPEAVPLADIFDAVKGRLARQAAELDASAVIHIHFEFRTPQPGLESSRFFDVFACGTAVKILSP